MLGDTKTTRQCRVVLEEGGGLEPPESYPSMVFETIPFGRSGTLPRRKVYRRYERLEAKNSFSKAADSSARTPCSTGGLCPRRGSLITLYKLAVAPASKLAAP